MSNYLPNWFINSSLAFCLAIMGVRLLLLRNPSEMDRLINFGAGAWTVVLIFRWPLAIPVVASRIPGGEPMLFDLWHVIAVMGWASLFGMFALRNFGPVGSKPARRAATACCIVISLALMILGEASRSQGLMMLEYYGWEYGAYFALYITPAVVTCLYILVNTPSLHRAAKTWISRLAIVIMTIFAAGCAIDLCSIGVAAMMDGFWGVNSTITREARVRAAGGLIPVWVTLTLTTLLWSSVRAVLEVTRLDQDSRKRRRMNAIWRELTAAVPSVVLPLKLFDRVGQTATERLHRRRVEINDAAEVIARYALPLAPELESRVRELGGDSADELRMVVQVKLGARAMASQKTMQLGAGCRVPDEDALLRWWETATREVANRGAVEATVS